MSLSAVFQNEYFQEGSKAIHTSKKKLAISAVDKAVSYLIQNFGEDLTLDDLAAAAGITKFNLCRSFQRRFGVTPMKWLWTFRTLLASEFIRLAPSWSLTDVAFTCGFTSSAHFSRSFSTQFKASPSDFRKASREDLCDSGQQVSGLQDYDIVYEDNEEVVKQAYQRMMAHLEIQPLSH